jgi:hypothetical protein
MTDLPAWRTQPPESERINTNLQAEAAATAEHALELLGRGSSTRVPAAPGTPAARLAPVSPGDVRYVAKEMFQNIMNAAFVLASSGERVNAPNIHRVLEEQLGPVPPSKPNFRTLEHVSHALSTSRVRQGLLDRGYEVQEDAPRALSAEMIEVIRAIVEPNPGLTLKQRLRGAGVTFAQYQGWLAWAPFRDALTRASEQGLKGAIGMANTRLTELAVEKGDLRAIKHLQELTGYFTPGEKQTLDVMQMIGDVMLVVMKHVKDPETLLTIGAEFRVIQERMALGGAIDSASRGETGARVAPAMAALPEAAGYVDPDEVIQVDQGELESAQSAWRGPEALAREAQEQDESNTQ